MGLGPSHCAQTGVGRPEGPGCSVILLLSGVVGCPEGVGRPKGLKFPLFSYCDGGTGWGSIVRALGGVGRPDRVGRPGVVALVGWVLSLAGVPGVGRPAWSSRPEAVVS